MGPYLVYAVIGLSCLLGIFRPLYGLSGYLFLVLMQPEWIWRFEGLSGFYYQRNLMICILVGYFLNMSHGNGIFRIRHLTVSAILLVALLGVSRMFSDYPQVSVQYYDGLWKAVLVMMLLFHLVDSPKNSVFVGTAMAAGSFYNALRLNLDYLSVGWCRWIRDGWGYKGDSNVICLFEMPAIAVSLVLLLTSRSNVLRLAALLSLMVHVHMVFILESRGAMLGLAALFFMAFIFVPKTPKMIGIAAVVTVLVLYFAGPPVVREFSSIFVAQEDRDASAESRFKLWRAAILVGVDHPLLGVGPYAGQEYIPRYEPAFAGVARKHPHNVFFEVLSGGGFPSLICFLTLFCLPVLKAYRMRKRYRSKSVKQDWAFQYVTLLPIVGFPAIAVTGMFCGSGNIETIYCFVGITLGGLVSYEAMRDSAKEHEMTEAEDQEIEDDSWDAEQMPDNVAVY